jgi:hypothetical protein
MSDADRGSGADADLPARCEAEVVALHEFFEAWLSGRAARTGETFARVPDVLDPGFHIVSPSGDVRGHDRIVADLEGAHGAQPDGFVIRIENVQVRDVAVVADAGNDGDGRDTGGVRAVAGGPDGPDGPDGDRCLCTYEEWQTDRHGDGVETGRLSTVLFREAPDAPGGVAWLHVHETWLPGHGPDGG